MAAWTDVCKVIMMVELLAGFLDESTALIWAGMKESKKVHTLAVLLVASMVLTWA